MQRIVQVGRSKVCKQKEMLLFVFEEAGQIIWQEIKARFRSCETYNSLFHMDDQNQATSANAEIQQTLPKPYFKLDGSTIETSRTSKR